MENEFREYLSNKLADGSITNYVSGIESIERTYSIDIDNEYDNGRLESLKERIKVDSSLRDDQKDDWPSFINKYIEFKNRNNQSPKYWMFTSGTRAEHWATDYSNNRMSGNWNIRSLTEFNSLGSIKREFESGSKEPSIVKDFKSVRQGDYVFSRQGNSKIVGLGIVIGDYEYDNNANDYRHFYRVNWLAKLDLDFNIRQKGQFKPTIYEISTNELSRLVSHNEKIRSFLDGSINNGEDFERNDSFAKGLCDLKSNNIILYGPPGTGKTYNSVIYAVRICEPDFISKKTTDEDQYEEYFIEFNKLKKEGRIQFTTFHQSYGYEEFIEGIKPIINETDENNSSSIKYKIENGVFKTFCNDARFSCAWDELVHLAIERGEITVELTEAKRKLVWNSEKARFDIKTRGLKNEYVTKDMVKRLYQGSYIRKDNNGTDNVRFYTSKAIINFMRKNELFSVQKSDHPQNPYVFIIDEINRGNISKIFGELITLIEDSKREGNREAMTVTLPYSSETFSVPKNVYILGTMNTADRSIAMMDTALRRRFQFIEKTPNADLLKDLDTEFKDNINLKYMLETINDRIRVLYDREHTIGHAYFLNVKTFEDLKDVFLNKIIPLLQEYFYDDYEKIRLVLGDNQKGKDEYSFVIESKNKSLFGNNHDYDEEKCYEINTGAFSNYESYIGIYEQIKSNLDTNETMNNTQERPHEE